MSSVLDEIVFSQTYNFTDCLAMDVESSLHRTLTIMALGAAYTAGTVRSNLWAIITPTTGGYRVDLFREKENFKLPKEEFDEG